MYLINVQAVLDIEEERIPLNKVLKHFYGTELDGIQYVVLSHCFCATKEQELRFNEIRDLSIDAAGKLEKHVGYQKIVWGCNKAHTDGIEWLWAAPCCVSWENSTDLSKAVNSMYRWYANSVHCYAYLHDVYKHTLPPKDIPWTLAESKWFSCCWTLQVLIATRNIRFVNCHWVEIGTKTNLVSRLATLTNIPQGILSHGLPPRQHPLRPSVAQIMSWSAKRHANRVEEHAYSLIGLFEVHMTVQYGEKENAFQRLQEAIIKEYNDHTIFAWFGNERRGSVLADKPSCFEDSSDIIRLDPLTAFATECPEAIAQLKVHRGFQVTKRGIALWLPVIRGSGSRKHAQAKLACCRKGNPQLITLNLSAPFPEYDDVFLREIIDSSPPSGEPLFERLYFVHRQTRLIPQTFGHLTQPDEAFVEQYISQLDGNASDIVPLLLDEMFQWTTNLDDCVVDVQSEDSVEQAGSWVYKGLLPSAGTLVAVRIPCTSHSAWNREHIERQLHELSIWSMLNHQNILPLLGITTTFSFPISIVAEWTQQNALYYVQNCNIDPRLLCQGIACALAYLHNHELGVICHGNLRAENVQIASDGRPLLANFTNSSFVSSLFMGPVLQWVHSINKPSKLGDRWDFGMTILELLTRRASPPQHQRSSTLTRGVHAVLPHRPGEETCSHMTDQWWDICSSCWSPDSLFPTMSHIVEKIADVMAVAVDQEISDTAPPSVLAIPASPQIVKLSEQSARDRTKLESTAYERSIRTSPGEGGTIVVNDEVSISAARGLTYVYNDPSSVGFREALRELTQRATPYGVNLDGRVSRDRPCTLLGGYAIVYVGTMGEHRVAIRTSRTGPPNDESTLKKLLRVVHLWSKLNHPNVLALLGITTDFDMTVSTVSPWMEKGNAHDYVQNTAVDPRPLIEGIAKGMHYLHNHEQSPIFHGNLNGTNVLISNDGRPLLTDFSLSYIVHSSFSMTVSSTGGVKGISPWMALELLEGGEPSAEADVWAFGMTALELFTRKRPFHEVPTIAGLFVRISSGRTPDRPSTEDTCARMTNEWWDICSKCWEFDPTDRPTMADVMKRITTIQTQSLHDEDFRALP